MGGLALALSWAVAHQILRGAVPMSQWSLETIGRAVWPPDVTRRLPAIVVAACCAGGLSERGPRVARGAVLVVATAGLAWVLTESLRRTGTGVAASCGVSVAGAAGMAWVWAVVERVGARRAPITWAWRMAVLVLAVGAVLMAAGAHSLGLVILAGCGPVVVLGLASRRSRGPTVGRAAAGVIASAMGVGAMGAWLASGWIGVGGIAAAVAGWVVLAVRGGGAAPR